MHFIGKELVEDRPALFPLHRAAAGPVAKAVEEIVPFQLEIDVVRYARPAVKGGDEMQQHLVAVRSEEHTSELQSLMRISYAVFCLKKKKIILLTTSAQYRSTSRDRTTKTMKYNPQHTQRMRSSIQHN